MDLRQGQTIKKYLKNDNLIPSLEIKDLEQDIFEYRQSILIQKFREGHPIISGHVPFLASLKDSYPDYHYFTVIRNPLSRYISDFNFIVDRGLSDDVNHELIQSRGVEYAFDKFMDSEDSHLRANTLSLFFLEAGKHKVDRATLADATALSDKVIRMFDYIGSNEKMEELEDFLRMSKIISKRDKIGMYNRGSDYSKNKLVSLDSLSLSQKNRLMDLCSTDLSLWERLK